MKEIPTGKQLVICYDNSSEFVEVEKDKPLTSPTPDHAHSEKATVLWLKHRTKSNRSKTSQNLKPPVNIYQTICCVATLTMINTNNTKANA